MSKRVVVKQKPQPANLEEQTAWVTGKASQEKEPMVRFTFDVPESLHRRIKIACAERGIKRVAVEMRRILEEHFPERSR
jgi:hypothetical protein